MKTYASKRKAAPISLHRLSGAPKLTTSLLSKLNSSHVAPATLSSDGTDYETRTMTNVSISSRTEGEETDVGTPCSQEATIPAENYYYLSPSNLTYPASSQEGSRSLFPDLKDDKEAVEKTAANPSKRPLITAGLFDQVVNFKDLNPKPPSPKQIEPLAGNKRSRSEGDLSMEEATAKVEALLKEKTPDGVRKVLSDCLVRLVSTPFDTGLYLCRKILSKMQTKTISSSKALQIPILDDKVIPFFEALLLQHQSQLHFSVAAGCVINVILILELDLVCGQRKLVICPKQHQRMRDSFSKALKMLLVKMGTPDFSFEKKSCWLLNHRETKINQDAGYLPISCKEFLAGLKERYRGSASGSVSKIFQGEMQEYPSSDSEKENSDPGGFSPIFIPKKSKKEAVPAAAVASAEEQMDLHSKLEFYMETNKRPVVNSRTDAKGPLQRRMVPGSPNPLFSPVRTTREVIPPTPDSELEA